MPALSILTVLTLSSGVMLQEEAVTHSDPPVITQTWNRVYSAYGSSRNGEFRVQNAIGLSVAPHRSTNGSYQLSSGYKVREATVYLFRDSFEGK